MYKLGYKSRVSVDAVKVARGSKLQGGEIVSGDVRTAAYYFASEKSRCDGSETANDVEHS